MKQIEREPQSLRGRVLALLLLAYIFNFLDRNVAGVLAVPIRAEFHLSDTALSELGIAFGLFYATVAIPIARLADRRSRANIIAISVAVWSLFSAACGLVGSFTQLVITRAGVAIGEAGAIAPSYSLITDYYPRERRSRALALYSLGIPIGSGLGLFFGGWLAGHFSWRAAFVVVGLPGLFVALLIKLLVPEPERGRFDRQKATSASAWQTAATLARNPSFWLLSLGAASGSITGYGLLFWLPSFFNRTFGLPVSETGAFFGSIFLVGGIAGIWLGGWLGDRLGPSRPAAYALIPALCLLVAIPLYAAGLFAPSLVIVWVLLTVAQVLALAWLGPVVTAVQHIVTPVMRATTSASFLFINNLVGIAFGTFFFGWFSDAMKAAHGANSLQYSILYGLGFYVLASVFYLLAAARLKRDMTS
jgi:MFS family permease